MHANALAEAGRGATDVGHHHRNEDPPGFLDAGQSLFVPEHRFSAGVKVHTLVFGRHHGVRPSEVHPPAFAVAAVDQMLQFGTRQAVLEHDQPSLALHRRFRASIGDRQQVAHPDDPASALLLFRGGGEFGRGAPP